MDIPLTQTELRQLAHQILTLRCEYIDVETSYYVADRIRSEGVDKISIPKLSVAIHGDLVDLGVSQNVEETEQIIDGILKAWEPPQILAEKLQLSDSGTADTSGDDE
ncbi:hypothetical protein HDU84_000437, partial [Entophlyctis sp. JEL0112]